MTVGDTLSMAWANLDRRKGRTALTAAGVVIGVATLVLMVSLGLGVQKQAVRLFETDESLRTLRVHRVKGEPGKKKSQSFGFGLDVQIVPLTDKDLDEIRKIPDVAGAWPELDMFLRIAVDGVKGVVQPVEGVAPEEEGSYAKHVVAGAMWSDRGQRVCLVPKAILESRLNLKPEEAIGRKITFSAFLQEEGEASPEDEFTIVGILGDEAFSFMGKPILMPLERGLSLRDRRGGGGHPMFPAKKGSYLFARLRLKDPRASQDVAARLRNLGFQPLSAVELLKQINVIFLVLEGFMACIGAIGLVVSLFGIANTMAMAVLERTREIGILKALGARSRDIRRVFLLEAAGIGAAGGLIGLTLGFLAGVAMNAAAHWRFDLPAGLRLFYVSFPLAAGAVGFAILVSAVAGFFPARRAARLDPVGALRYE